MKGRLSKDVTVWCGGCANWHGCAGDTFRDAAKEIVELGWEKYMDMGWMCPVCLGKEDPWGNKTPPKQPS